MKISSNFVAFSKNTNFNKFFSTLFQYADPVADLLDKWDVFACRLFRESCVFHRGNYVKDLSRLGRELHKIIIVDNSPASYVFHPDNAVSIIFIHLRFQIHVEGEQKKSAQTFLSLKVIFKDWVLQSVKISCLLLNITTF